jgi:hypothetical protein
MRRSARAPDSPPLRSHSPSLRSHSSSLRPDSPSLRSHSPSLRSHSRSLRSLRVMAAAIAVLICSAVALGDSARVYRNATLHVRGVEPPFGWEPQPTGSYTRLLAAWADKDGAKITLVASKVAPAATAQSVADEARPALARMGWRYVVVAKDATIPGDSGRLRLEAQLDDGRKLARQLYVVSGGIGYVLTLIGASSRAPQLKRDFDETAQSLAIGAEPRPSADAGADVDVDR